MNDLYKAIVAYEDAANEVGRMSIITQGAYVQLAKAIGGWGDLEEARARFRLESAAFVNASDALTAAAGRIDLALAEPNVTWPRVQAERPSAMAGAEAWDETPGTPIHNLKWKRPTTWIGTEASLRDVGERYRSWAEREPGLSQIARGTTGCGEDA